MYAFCIGLTWVTIFSPAALTLVCPTEEAILLPSPYLLSAIAPYKARNAFSIDWKCSRLTIKYIRRDSLKVTA